MISEQRDPPSRVANAVPGVPRGDYAMSPAARDAASGLPSHNPNPLLGFIRMLAGLPPPQRARLLAALLAARRRR